jgi:transposase
LDRIGFENKIALVAGRVEVQILLDVCVRDSDIASPEERRHLINRKLILLLKVYDQMGQIPLSTRLFSFSHLTSFAKKIELPKRDREPRPRRGTAISPGGEQERARSKEGPPRRGCFSRGRVLESTGTPIFLVSRARLTLELEDALSSKAAANLESPRKSVVAPNRLHSAVRWQAGRQVAADRPPGTEDPALAEHRPWIATGADQSEPASPVYTRRVAAAHGGLESPTDDEATAEGSALEEQVAPSQTPSDSKRPKRRPLPDNLPKEVRRIEIPESGRKCPCCGETRCEMGVETSQQLEFIPATFKVIEFQRVKYACKKCEENVVVAEEPAKPIEKGLPGPGLCSYVILSKFGDHLPLYREEDMFSRMGWTIHRSVLSETTQLRLYMPRELLLHGVFALKVRLASASASSMQLSPRPPGFYQTTHRASASWRELSLG